MPPIPVNRLKCVNGFMLYSSFLSPYSCGLWLCKFLRAGRHYAVKLGVCREAVYKGEYHVSVENKPLPCFGVGHIGISFALPHLAEPYSTPLRYFLAFLPFR